MKKLHDVVNTREEAQERVSKLKLKSSGNECQFEMRAVNDYSTGDQWFNIYREDINRV